MAERATATIALNLHALGDDDLLAIHQEDFVLRHPAIPLADSPPATAQTGTIG
jgi:hypothetical protein